MHKQLEASVESKWAITNFAVRRILVGNMILFGFVELNQFVGNVIGTRSANTLAAENDILRQPFKPNSPAMSNLEMQTMKFSEPVIELPVLLQNGMDRNNDLSFTTSTEGVKVQSFMLTHATWRLPL